MKRLFGFLMVIAFVVISCTAQENSLIGTWRFTDGNETADVEFTQTKLRQMTVDGKELGSCGYKIDGNKVYPLDDNGVIASDFYLLLQDKNTLDWVFDDGTTFTGKKIGGSTSNQNASKNSIIGTYTSDGDSFLETIEIVDGKNVVLKYSLFDTSSTTSATYKVTGSRLTVTNGKDTILFEINNGSLKGLTIGSTGTFYKE